MNSRLSNSGPEDKFRQLVSESERKNQSLKALEMHSVFVAQKAWLADVSMHEHANQMFALMQRAFGSGNLIDLTNAEQEAL